MYILIYVLIQVRVLSCTAFDAGLRIAFSVYDNHHDTPAGRITW